MFTNRRPGNLIKRTTASSPSQLDTDRTAQNLLKGIQNFDGWKTSCLINQGEITFAFPTPTVVREVVVMGHFLYYEPELPTENTKIYAIASGHRIELGNYANGKPLETRSFFSLHQDLLPPSSLHKNNQVVHWVEIFA